jgi:hypothetical protein
MYVLVVQEPYDLSLEMYILVIVSFIIEMYIPGALVKHIKIEILS